MGWGRRVGLRWWGCECVGLPGVLLAQERDDAVCGGAVGFLGRIKRTVKR